MRRKALIAALLGLVASPALAQPIAPTNPVAASTPPVMSTRPSPAQMTPSYAPPAYIAPAVPASTQPISPVLPATPQTCNCLPTAQTAPEPAHRAVYRRRVTRRPSSTTQAAIGMLPPVDMYPRTYSTGVYAYGPRAVPVSTPDTVGFVQFPPIAPPNSGQDDYITDGVMGGSAGLGGPGPNNIGW